MPVSAIKQELETLRPMSKTPTNCDYWVIVKAFDLDAQLQILCCTVCVASKCNGTLLVIH